MEVILPCAGLSTRFPDMRPKYLLTDYTGKIMIENVIAPYVGLHRIRMVVLAEHQERYRVVEMMEKIFGGSVEVAVLPERTKGPAETVYRGLLAAGVDSQAGVLIRDCDSFFNHDALIPGNRVHVASLDDHPNIRNAAGKSYVIANDQGIVDTIVEKSIVSNVFCVGGYQFNKAADFISAYENLSSAAGEPFVSNCIDYLISRGAVFEIQRSSEWVDVGTAKDWTDYNDRPTIFCDIDGTIVENQSQWGSKNYFTDPVPLTENVAALVSAAELGCQIIFTTARPEKYRARTTEVLDGLGFRGYQLLMGLHHSRRILINDYAPSNPYPSAVAINLRRDSRELPAMLNIAGNR